MALVSAYIIGSGSTKKITTKSGKIQALFDMVDILEYKSMKIRISVDFESNPVFGFQVRDIWRVCSLILVD